LKYVESKRIRYGKRPSKKRVQVGTSVFSPAFFEDPFVSIEVAKRVQVAVVFKVVRVLEARLNGSVQGLESLLQATREGAGAGQVVEGEFILRIDPAGNLEVVNRLGVVLEQEVGEAEMIVSLEIEGELLDDLAELAGGALVFA